MEFKRVRFNNFRNISPREIKFAPGLNLLCGSNGSGKTNIIEGINILSGWGILSKGDGMNSIATWNSGTTDVQLTGEVSTGEIVTAKYSGKMIIRVDEKPVRATDMRLKIPAMAFLPNDMSIIEGSSMYRRRIIDMALALIVPSYAFNLSEYRRGIRQKTFLLHRGIQTLIADKVLAPLASWIWKMRGEAVKLFQSCLEENMEILPAEIKLSLKRGGGGMEYAEHDDYIKSVMAQREREMAMRCPIVGPHRDDILITAGNLTAASALSRGQRRRCAIALILAAASAVRRKLGVEPILLLDEVMAELDSEGKEMLIKLLLKRESQVFAASAEEDVRRFRGTVHIIKNGEVQSTFMN